MKIIKSGVKKRVLRKWLQSSLKLTFQELNVNPCPFNIVFVGDSYIRKLNKEYFGRDEPTDVIAFPFNSKDFLGEIYISTPTVARNARRYDVSFNEEIVRVAVHGLLHLLGYEDETLEGKQKMYEMGERFVKESQ